MRFDLFGGYNVYNYGFKGTYGFKSTAIPYCVQPRHRASGMRPWHGALFQAGSVELKREDRADYYYRRASTQPTDMNV